MPFSDSSAVVCNYWLLLEIMLFQVGPQEIYVVTRGDYDEYPAPASDASGNADNCGTFEDGSMELVNKTNEVHCR